MRAPSDRSARVMKLAVNPLQYYLTPDGEIDWEAGPAYDDVLADVARSGFAAVQSKWDLSASPHAFRRRLASHGLKPAPAYFAGPIGDPASLPELQRRFARALEATVDLGLSEIVVACPVEPALTVTAGQRAGRAIDTAQLSRIADTLETLGHAAGLHGVRLCFHPHVATAVETPDEVAFIVENTHPNSVALCADTGHLAWGGMNDVPAFVEALTDRIGVLHLKDVDTRLQRTAARSGWSYAQSVRNGLWKEPGAGDLDLDAIMRSWSTGDRWCVVEVDAPSRSTPYESLLVCADYARRWTA